MRVVGFEQVVEAVEKLCIEAAYELPGDVITAIKKAAERETNADAAQILRQLVENARIASQERIPLCQDTGLAVVFVEQGSELAVKCPAGKTLVDAVNAGVAAGYEKGYLRKSVVGEPLKERKNTGTNTPAIIHHSIAAGDRLKLTVMLKGGGCENKSQFKMFKPTAEVEEIINWVVEAAVGAGADACPPVIVGVGIGGDFEVSGLLGKKALLRQLDKPNGDEFYARFEAECLSRINASGVGPQGLGGDTTALACLVETAACHIASLPVAVNIECHSHRHKTTVL